MTSELEEQKSTLRDETYEFGFLVLAGLFVASLVTCNLIFQKFFSIEIPLPWGSRFTFTQSVGILAYPLTFLVTDILSEIYGARRARNVVTVGLLSSLFVTLLIEVSDAVPSAPFGIGDETFSRVFGLQKWAVFSSMVAYLAAQYLDVRLFHFWRRLTNGKHLWLRNNASTITSQFVDTFVVLALLASYPETGITWDNLPELLVNGLLFKWFFAAFDTPLFYLAVHVLRRRFPEQIRALYPEDSSASVSD